MKSWMSTRRPACAPPPKIWISGSGTTAFGGVAEQVAHRSACQPPPRRRAAPPSIPRPARCRRAGFFAVCRRGRSGRGRSPPGRPRPCPISAAAISPLIAATAPRTSRPPSRRRRRAVRPPRPSRSRRRPARSRGRPRRPPAAIRPRRSGGRANPIRAGRAPRQCACRSPAHPRGGPGFAHRVERIDRLEQQCPRDTPDAVLVFLGRDIFDRRLAVDARQEQRRQQACRALFDVLVRLPGRPRRDRSRASWPKAAR